MKNFGQNGNVITLTAPYAVTAGQGLLVGALFGVAQFDAALNASVEAQVNGVVDLTAETGQALTVGQVVYWDNPNRRVTGTVGTNTRIGVATIAKASPTAVARVRLNGSF